MGRVRLVQLLSLLALGGLVLAAFILVRVSPDSSIGDPLSTRPPSPLPTSIASPASLPFEVERANESGPLSNLPESVDPDRTEVASEIEVGAGSILAEWSNRLVVGEIGLVTVEIRALDDLPTSAALTQLAYVAPTDDDPIGKIALPIYVRPGLVDVELTATDGLTVREDGVSTRSSVKRFNVQAGTVATRTWSVEATRARRSALLVLTTRGVEQANPEQPIADANLQLLRIEEMELTLELEVSTEVASPTTDPPIVATSRVGDGWRWSIAMWSLLGLSAPFVLWLLSDWLDRRNRAPGLARALGYLPHKLAEFKHLRRRDDADAAAPSTEHVEQ